MSFMVNDGSMDPPCLQVYLNLGTLQNLRSDTIWPQLEGGARDQRLLDDGFDGVQLTDPEKPAGSLLPYCGLDRINLPEEAEDVASRHAGRGDSCITVHVGWGIEDDAEVSRLLEAVLEASSKHHLPIFVETHRATITQDLWRTVQIAKRFPQIRFNADFSHYYCGQELVYGDWEQKMAFMQPIYDAVGFMHGRIASPGCMQVPIDKNLEAKPLQAHGPINYLDHFRDLWTRAMTGFLAGALPGDQLIFAPELLHSRNYYARMFPDAAGALREESDRYEQALLYMKLARHCFRQAQDAVTLGRGIQPQATVLL